jgi:DNA repair exonuclease SbcCD nuclease subunit
MAKIIHASDFCLGRQFSDIGRAGDFVRRALKESLESAVTLALDRSVDLFLVSGNLFASNMVSCHLVDFVFQQVERLGRTPFAVLPGIRDCLEENSIYRLLPTGNRPENFYLLNSRQGPYLSFPESEITVYGATCFGERTAATEQSLPVKSDLPGVHIVAVSNPESPDAAGGSLDFGAIVDAITKAGFDYVAVGGLDYRRWNDYAYSSGSPETQEFESIESGQVLLVDISRSHPVIEKCRTGQMVWKQLELDNARFRYSIELEEELLKHASSETLLQIRFDGEFTPEGYVDLTALENEFRDRFCCLRIEDTRRIETNCVRVGGTGGDTLLTDYTYLLEDAIEKATPERRPQYLQALVTGNAMLSGKDVIS